jgi:CheY-like chemotaxis protein
LSEKGDRSSKERAMARGARVLMVDDDQDFLASVRPILESEGHSVIEATSGKQALERLVEEKPDIVIVDIVMATSTDGYGVTHSIRHREDFREFRSIPIIMVSSIEQSPDDLFPMAGEVELIRPDMYLTKPLDIPKFLECVRSALRN